MPLLAVIISHSVNACLMSECECVGEMDVCGNVAGGTGDVEVSRREWRRGRGDDYGTPKWVVLRVVAVRESEDREMMYSADRLRPFALL
jgi:hypothetical protein